MFYSVDNKIVQVGEAFPERVNNTLTFTVEGETFPNPFLTTVNTRVELRSDTPNSLSINYGDGTVVTEDFLLTGGEYQMFVKWDTLTQSTGIIPLHNYKDSNVNERDITFDFLDLSSLTTVTIQDVRLKSKLPEEIKNLKKLKSFNLIRTKDLTSLDFELPKNAERIDFASIGDVTFDRLPDSVFSSTLKILFMAGLFDIQDVTSSNLFKIRQLSSTLEQLRIGNVTALPSEITQCNLLNFLEYGGNLEEIQTFINNIPSLTNLRISGRKSITYNLIDFSNLNKVNSLLLNLNDVNLEGLNIKWVGLKSLEGFLLFQFFIKNNIKFDEFIDEFYLLTTQNGFLDPASLEAIATGFPNQFRNVSWGHSSLTQTGTIQAPAGFELGVSNGNLPMTQGEKIYVLKENYGHTITTAQP